LTLIGISHNGAARLLLPNYFQKDNQARPGYVYKIPSENAKFTYKAKEPVGEEKVLAIATLENVPLYAPEDVKVEDKSLEFAKDASLVEESVYMRLSALEPGRWKGYWLTVTISN